MSMYSYKYVPMPHGEVVNKIHCHHHWLGPENLSSTVKLDIFTLYIFSRNSRLVLFRYPGKYVHHENYFYDSLKSHLFLKHEI